MIESHVNLETERLSGNHRSRIKSAYNQLNKCPKCMGKPWISYEPGCCYTVCVPKSPKCPCLAAAPDMELDLLVETVNRKINQQNKAPTS